jgi:O-acetyl-ADP-ribose deacetylase (regulator of RNase III)
MEITLAAIEEELATAWKMAFQGFPSINVYGGSILDLKVDAVVSPANSFGFMDGGIDLEYLLRFGPQLQGRLQDRIAARHGGELLVGQAEILETFDRHIPYLISAPTMRVPMLLRDSVAPFLATRAVLRLIRHGFFPDGDMEGQPIGHSINHVAFPGLGTGIGQIPFAVCARQMKEAIDRESGDAFQFPGTTAEASASHFALLAQVVNR